MKKTLTSIDKVIKQSLVTRVGLAAEMKRLTDESVERLIKKISESNLFSCKEKEFLLQRLTK